MDEFRAWKTRDLSQLNILYLIVDGIRLGVRTGTREKEAVLVAQGFLENGKRVLLNVALGVRESYNSWNSFLTDMKERGLNDPLLIITDGSPGPLRALEEIFPDVDRKRCTKHKMTNEHAKEAITLFERKWRRRFPSAVECLLKDIDSCLTYYKFPYIHWKRIRTINAIERGFREVRQRVRGIGRFKDEERNFLCLPADERKRV